MEPAGQPYPMGCFVLLQQQPEGRGPVIWTIVSASAVVPVGDRTGYSLVNPKGNAGLETVRLKKSLIPCESIFKRWERKIIGGSDQFKNGDFRQDAHPARITQEAKTPVHIEFLTIFMFIQTGPFFIEILYGTPFKTGYFYAKLHAVGMT